MSGHQSFFLEKLLALLIEQFGAEQVARTLSKLSGTYSKLEKRSGTDVAAKKTRGHAPNILHALETVRRDNAEKHELLFRFYDSLKLKKTLPESQDIQQFAQIVGLKEISGKSRDVLIAKLMRFLIERSLDQIRLDTAKAEKISEKERQQGFSVLTDKLLGG